MRLTNLLKFSLSMFALWLAPIVFANTLVIYPLASQDTLLGIAVADRLAQMFEGELEVYGPDISPSLAPPLVAQEGFFNLLNIAEPITTQEGARLLRDILGADYLLSGQINFQGDRLEAEFILSSKQGISTFSASAPQEDPDLLLRQAAVKLAGRLGKVQALVTMNSSIDLSGPYGDYTRAVALLGAGDIEQARNLLEETGASEEEPRLESLLNDVRAVLLGQAGSRAALMSTMSLNVTPFDEAIAIDYFSQFAENSSLPVAETWLATLYASADMPEASTWFDQAASYPFGLAARAAFRTVNSLDAEADRAALLTTLLTTNDRAALLSASLIAQIQEDLATEKAALQQLTHLAPSYVYPFERLSFIAFDEEDAKAAGEALAVAVELEPESDLYWTNLGWAYYLLGVLDKSESASIRAVTLDPSQHIAFYNLGLTQAVTGRLSEAMEAYQSALALDPEVDDEAIHDLENALELYPAQAGVHYALATLYEQEGRRDEAAEQFAAYLARGAQAPFERLAKQRYEVLTAPPPPIEISPGASLGLGSNQLQTSSFQPGDRIYPSFELFTPGSELPRKATVQLKLSSAEGEVISEREAQVDIPQNAIGYVVDTLGIDLPSKLAAGSYTLDINASASDEQQTQLSLVLEVSGQPGYLRQLISRNIVMQELDSGSALYGENDLSHPDDTLLRILQSELQNSAEAADEALPEISTGRFMGFSGGKLFSESTEQDIRDFLDYLLSGGTSDATFHFVDAYAQWAVDGAPSSAE